MKRDRLKNWESMSDSNKIYAIETELSLAFHKGTTKDDLLIMLGWLFDQFNVVDVRNDPLTIEELKEMSGKPFWFESKLNLKYCPGEWRILNDNIAKNPQDYHYGESWLAYRMERALEVEG